MAGGLDAVHPRHPDVHQHDVGEVRPGGSERARTVRGLGHDLDAGLGAQDQGESRPHQGLVVGDHDADHGSDRQREDRVDAEAALGPGADAQVAVVHRHPLAHPGQAVAARLGAGGAPSVIRHLDGDRGVGVGDAHRCVRGGRVLEAVGERLLHDPVCREVDARRDGSPGPRHRQRRRQPGLADPVDQVRRGRPASAPEREATRDLLVVAQDAAAGGASRPSTGGRPARSRRLRRAPASRSPVEQAPGSTGLHDHHAHRVAQHVVQLAGDPEPLVGGGGPDVRLGALTPVPDPGAEQQHRTERGCVDARRPRD